MKNILYGNVLAKNADCIFYSVIAVALIICGFNLFLSSHCLADQAEHIKASFLIGSGLIPYRDFFEHHNPLMWFILVPLVGLFKNNLIIFLILKFVSYALYILLFYTVYKLTEKFLFGEKSAKLAIISLISVPFILLETSVIRPDIFMHLCFMAGLYFFYSYLSNHKRNNLIISYLLMTLSVLFLQKILILCFGFALTNLYLLIEKEIKIKDFAISAVCALIPLFLFIGYFYHYDALGDWFYYNFIFNAKMQEYYGNFTGVFIETKLYTLVAVFCILINLPKNKNGKIYAFIFLFQAISLLIWRPHLQYYLSFWIFAAPLIGYTLAQKIRFNWHYIVLITLAVISLFLIVPNKDSVSEYEKYMADAKYILKRKNNDTVLDFGTYPADVFGSINQYYWFGFQNVVIIDILTNNRDYLELNSFMKETKPEIIRYIKHNTPVLTDMIVIDNVNFFRRRNILVLNKAANNPDFLSKLIKIDVDFWEIDEQWIADNYTRIDNLNIWRKNHD